MPDRDQSESVPRGVVAIIDYAMSIAQEARVLAQLRVPAERWGELTDSLRYSVDRLSAVVTLHELDYTDELSTAHLGAQLDAVARVLRRAMLDHFYDQPDLVALWVARRREHARLMDELHGRALEIETARGVSR